MTHPASAPEPTTFGRELRLLRRRARLTQAELGIAVGYSDAQICRLETGRRPPDLTTLVALFLPALDLQPDSAAARTLLALAAEARSGLAPGAEPAAAEKPSKGSDVGPPAQADASAATPAGLVGRKMELALLTERLAAAEVRLLTVIGPPGVGKTTLARAAATLAAPRFADGAVFVDLTSLDEPAELPLALARALAIPEEAHPDALTAVGVALRARRHLLLLDNAEHLLGIGPQLLTLLSAAPGLRILVTSRAALRLDAEQVFALAPLAVPDLGALPDLPQLALVPAVALLLTRLRALDPAFALTAQNALPLAAICVRLDGLPLALELVAARGRLLAPPELLAEVEQHFLQLRRGGAALTRHQSIAAVLAASYDQLPPAAQTLFVRLGAFSGSWTASAAAEICDLDGVGRAALLDALDLLLDHSLVQRGADPAAPRCSLLLLLREAARARLATPELERLESRLLDWCVQLAEDAEGPLTTGTAQAEWTARLEAEHHTLQGALRWAQQRGDGRGLRLAAALGRFWYNRGYLREGRAWLESFLELPPRGSAALDRARVLDGGGLLAWRQGDYQQASRWYADALAIYEREEQETGIARVLLRLGLVAEIQGQAHQATDYYQRSLVVYRAIGHPVGTASVLHNLGNLANQHNQHGLAIAYYQQCLPLYRANNDQSGVALIQLGLGAIARDQGDLDGAQAAFAESLALAQGLGDQWNAATALLNLGDLAADRGEHGAALEHYGAALALFEQVGDQQSAATLQGRRGLVELAAGAQPAAIATFRQALLLASALQFQPGVADALEGLAACVVTRQPQLSARLLGAADGIRQRSGYPIPLAEQARHAQLVRVGQRADPAGWARWWQDGAALEAGQAVALALASVR